MARGVLRIVVMEARSLIDIATFGQQDPYVKMSVSNHYSLQTRVHSSGGTKPRWGDELVFDLTDDCWTHVVVEIFNKRPLLTDDLIAKAKIPYVNLMVADGHDEGWYDLFTKKEKPGGQIRLSLHFMCAPQGPGNRKIATGGLKKDTQAGSAPTPAPALSPAPAPTPAPTQPVLQQTTITTTAATTSPYSDAKAALPYPQTSPYNPPPSYHPTSGPSAPNPVPHHHSYDSIPRAVSQQNPEPPQNSHSYPSIPGQQYYSSSTTTTTYGPPQHYAPPPTQYYAPRPPPPPPTYYPPPFYPQQQQPTIIIGQPPPFLQPQVVYQSAPPPPPQVTYIIRR